MSTNEKLVPGMVLGRYELLLPIAQGGMATVWAARQKGSRGFQKTVAIKTMLPTLSDDPMFEQMFLDEASLAAKIHHPNVAEILDLGDQDETIYLVMEWVDGEALSILHKASRKNQIPFPHRIGLRIAIQACAGLHAAHELHDDNDAPLELVHRDVSPQNILVTYDGIVKLVDFGVAKASNRAGSETSAGQLKGKVPYMSPEQARGGRVDRRTDIFAMGIMLYKLMTGLHPFLGENDLVTMRNIISRPLLPARVKNPSFPTEIDQVLVKCMQKDPDKRYQTMVELGGALERALASLGVADDDVGGFVRGQLGERGAKRRAALREAVRVADERLATGGPPAPLPHISVPGDSISGLFPTQLTSAVRSDLYVDGASRISAFEVNLRAAQISTNPPSPRFSETSETAVEVPQPHWRKRTPRLLIGAGVAVTAITVALLFVLLRSSAGPAMSAASPTGTTGTSAESLTTSAQRTTAQPQAKAAPTDDPSAATPTSTANAVNIDDLPTTVGDTAAPKRPTASPAKPTTSAEPKPSAAASANKEAPKTNRPASNKWVPPVQDPGF
jgi:eukaryotic-like serine/threonine-protein kinase